MVSANLLEGKIVLLVEGSVMALVTPRRLVEFWMLRMTILKVFT